MYIYINSEYMFININDIATFIIGLEDRARDGFTASYDGR
jgi:hypothetical protein